MHTKIDHQLRRPAFKLLQLTLTKTRYLTVVVKAKSKNRVTKTNLKPTLQLLEILIESFVFSVHRHGASNRVILFPTFFMNAMNLKGSKISSIMYQYFLRGDNVRC